MPRKKSENEFQAMMTRYGIGRHKYGDVRYCIQCRMPQPKSERAPDYSVWPVYTWVECKETLRKGKQKDRWLWKEIYEGGARENQRKFLLENGGWLFILLGNGRVSKVREKSGRSAYLIPFKTGWVDHIEPMLLEKKMGSIQEQPMRGGKPGALEYLDPWRLDWGNEGWEIPDGHNWWHALHSVLTKKAYEVRQRI